MDLTYMTVTFTPDQSRLFKAVAKQMEKVECFEYQGVIFKGSSFRAAVEFAYNNPTGGDFYVWLQDNYTMLK
jgi:hypothetical protein